MTDSGTVAFGVRPNGTPHAIASGKSYNNGAWHLAAATLSPAGMRLYVDGTMVASDAGITTGKSGTGYWRVGFGNLDGAPNMPTSRYFAGSIDGAAVYTTALSASTIASQYAAGR